MANQSLRRANVDTVNNSFWHLFNYDMYSYHHHWGMELGEKNAPSGSVPEGGIGAWVEGEVGTPTHSQAATLPSPVIKGLQRVLTHIQPVMSRFMISDPSEKSGFLNNLK